MNRYALWALFGPTAWLLWSLGIAMLGLVAGGPRGIAVARWAITIGLALGVVLEVLPAGHYLIKPLETRFPVPPVRDLNAREIIVLAGGERLGAAARSGRPEAKGHGERVMEGAVLARALPSARLWAIGGNRYGPNSPRDIDWMRTAWVRLGVDPARIRLVGSTADTCENARGVARALGRERPPMLLVTSAFHMPRSVACFRAAGLDPLPYPVDFQNAPAKSFENTLSGDLQDNSERANLGLHEWVGILYYRATGRTRDWWPEPRPNPALRPG